MLEVNRKLGFVYAGATGQWVKNLDAFKAADEPSAAAPDLADRAGFP